MTYALPTRSSVPIRPSGRIPEAGDRFPIRPKEPHR